MSRKTVNVDESILKELKVYTHKKSRDFSSALRNVLINRAFALKTPELTTREIENILEAKAELEEVMFEEFDIEDL